MINPLIRYEQKFNEKISASTTGEFMRADNLYPFTLVNGDYVSKEKRYNNNIPVSYTHLLSAHGSSYQSKAVRQLGNPFSEVRHPPPVSYTHLVWLPDLLCHRHSYCRNSIGMVPASRLSCSFRRLDTCRRTTSLLWINRCV